MKLHEILIIAIAFITLIAIQYIPQPKRKPICNCEVIEKAYKDSLKIERDTRIRIQMRYIECRNKFK